MIFFYRTIFTSCQMIIFRIYLNFVDNLAIMLPHICNNYGILINRGILIYILLLCITKINWKTLNGRIYISPDTTHHKLYYAILFFNIKLYYYIPGYISQNFLKNDRISYRMITENLIGERTSNAEDIFVYSLK